jgi:hypothetical protein
MSSFWIQETNRALGPLFHPCSWIFLPSSNINCILNENNTSLFFCLKRGSSIAQPSDCVRVGKKHIIRPDILYMMMPLRCDCTKDCKYKRKRIHLRTKYRYVHNLGLRNVFILHTRFQQHRELTWIMAQKNKKFVTLNPVAECINKNKANSLFRLRY